MRPQNERASTRQNYETERGNRNLSPTQPLQVTERSTGLSQLMDSLEAIEPGAMAVAKGMEKREAKAQKQAAYAKAVSDQVAGNISPEEARRRNQFSNPDYAESYLSTRYSLMASDASRDIAEHIEANKHRPDFDADEYFQKTMQETLQAVPEEEYQQVVAEKIGVLYGKYQQNAMKRRLTDQQEETVDTYRADLRAHMADMDAVGNAPTPQAMEEYVEQAREMNLDPEVAREMYLKAAADYAVNKKKPGVLLNEDFAETMRNDPVLNETYEKAVDDARAAYDSKSNIEEFRFQEAYRSQVDDGSFTQATVQEISRRQNEMGKEHFSEEQLVNMLRRSRANRQKEAKDNQMLRGWYESPEDFMATYGESLTDDQFQGIAEKGFQRAVEETGSESEAMLVMAKKLTQSGDYGTWDRLSSMFTTRATSRSFEANPGGPTEGFQAAYDLYTKFQGMDGGEALLRRHLQTEDSELVMDTYDENIRSGLSPEEAWGLTGQLVNNAADREDYMTSSVARDIDNLVDDYSGETTNPTSRKKIRDLAHKYNRMWMEPKKALDKAEEIFKNTHVKIDGQWFEHHGSKSSYIEGVLGLKERIINDDKMKEDIAKAAEIRPSNFNPDELSVMQKPGFTKVLVPMYEDEPIWGASETINETMAYLKQLDEERREQIRQRMNDPEYNAEQERRRQQIHRR